MTLREELIAAMAPGPKGYVFAPAEEVLDSILDKLEERSWEWYGLHYKVMPRVTSWRHEPHMTGWLIKVLRRDYH